MFVEENAREEVIELSNLYLEESKKHLPTSDLQEKDAYLQRVDLLNIKQDLVLDRARRALRFLKKLDKADIAEFNKPLFNFLNYTTFMLLNNEDDAASWQSELSEVDLKKAQLILNINK